MLIMSMTFIDRDFKTINHMISWYIERRSRIVKPLSCLKMITATIFPDKK